MNIKEYLDNLKIRFCTNRKEPLKNLEEFMSKKEAAKVFYAFEAEVRKRSNNSKYADESGKIYEIINQTLETSLVFNGTYNYERIESIGNWIENNQTLLGNTIIDLGCMNGIITCYIALLCPNSKVIGIDLNESSIINAKKLADKLNINNIEFKVCNVFDCNSQYDTVFSSYVMHEVLTYDNDSIYMDKNGIINNAKESAKKWTNLISNLIKEDGKAFLFERMPSGFTLLGVMKAFEDNGLYFSDFKGEKLPDGNMMRMILQKANTSKNVESLWRQELEQFEVEGVPNVYDWEAISRMSLYADKLIKGYILYNDNKPVWKIMLATSSKDSTALYELSANPNENVCYCYDVSYKDDLLKDIEKTISNFNGEVKEIFNL